MKAKEFINETPLPTEQDPEKVWTHTGVWNNEYLEPGVLRSDGNYDVDDETDYESEQYDLLSRKNARHLGAGAEAVVIKYDDSHEVVKILGTNAKLSQCAHLQYLLACKKYMNSNPYLPRINSIKTVNYDGTRLLYTIEMESLEELSDSSDEDCAVMQSQMFNYSDENYLEKSTPTNVVRGVSAVLRYNESDANLKDVNPLLRKACQLIRAVANRVHPKGGLRELIDLHLGNTMVRRTSVGPQLVITDPLYSGPTGVRADYEGD